VLNILRSKAAGEEAKMERRNEYILWPWNLVESGHWKSKKETGR
jgi:hypothetical protein